MTETDDNTAQSQNPVRWKPLFKTLIKSGILLSRNVQSLGRSAAIELNRLVDEARAELDHKPHPSATSEDDVR